jgi:hypothetical protein
MFAKLIPVMAGQRGIAAAAALLLAALPLAGQAQTAADGAAAAAKDLYLKISARDSSVLRYVPAGGFSEINSGSDRHQLDARAFEKLFASPLKIDLHAEGVQAELLGGAALVTGTRVGSLTPPGQAPKEARHAFSMLWTQSNGQWQLQHVHLSAPVTAAP